MWEGRDGGTLRRDISFRAKGGPERLSKGGDA